jgi:hypothetical protein
LYLAAFGVVALLAWVDTQSLLQKQLFDLDDPYITLHNAQVLLSGHDSSYGPTHPLVGATSAIHLAVVTVLLVLFGAGWALHLANWIGIALYAAGIARLAAQHRIVGLRALLLIAAGFLVAETMPVLLNGMETGLAMAGIVWALVAATTPKPTRLLPVLCGLLPFLRPELGVLSFLLMGHQLWRHWEADRSAPLALRASGLDLALAAAVAAPWLLWYWLGTGTPIPQTMAAKRDFFAQAFQPAAVKQMLVGAALQRFCLFLGTFGWCAALLLTSRLGRLGLLFLGVFIGGCYLVFPGALAQNQQRYLYVALPFLLYGALTWLTSPREGPRFTATCLLVAVVAQSTFCLPHRWKEFMSRRQELTAELQTLTDWCHQNLPAHARLLIHDAGYMAFATEYPLTDMVGLKSPESAREHRELTWASAGQRRVEAIQDIALHSQAQFLIATTEWDRGFHLSEGLREFGWKVQLLNPPKECYHVYQLTPPGETPRPASQLSSDLQ